MSHKENPYGSILILLTNSLEEERGPKVTLLVLCAFFLLGGLLFAGGQPLVFSGVVNQFPKRPANPESIPNEGPGRRYDFEHAGWSTDKINIPKSPANGSIDRKIVMVAPGEHPYYTAYADAAKLMAKTHGINLKITIPNWDLNTWRP